MRADTSFKSRKIISCHFSSANGGIFSAVLDKFAGGELVKISRASQARPECVFIIIKYFSPSGPGLYTIQISARQVLYITIYWSEAAPVCPLKYWRNVVIKLSKLTRKALLKSPGSYKGPTSIYTPIWISPARLELKLTDTNFWKCLLQTLPPTSPPLLLLPCLGQGQFVTL